MMFYNEQTSQNCQLTRFSFMTRAHRRLDRDGFPKISATISTAHASSLCSLRLGCFVLTHGFKQLFVSTCRMVLFYHFFSLSLAKILARWAILKFCKPCWAILKFLKSCWAILKLSQTFWVFLKFSETLSGSFEIIIISPGQF